MSEKLKLIRLRICPCAFFHRVEKWLKKMSLEGWHLVARRFGCIYHFEKGVKTEKEYFIWGATANLSGEGKYSISMRYPFLAKTYGVKRKKSKLNQYSISTYDTIIEVDPKVINTIGYKELVSDRNRLYKLYCIRNFGILLISVLVLVIIPLLLSLLI